MLDASNEVEGDVVVTIHSKQHMSANFVSSYNVAQGLDRGSQTVKLDAYKVSDSLITGIGFLKVNGVQTMIRPECFNYAEGAGFFNISEGVEDVDVEFTFQYLDIDGDTDLELDLLKRKNVNDIGRYAELAYPAIGDYYYAHYDGILVLSADTIAEEGIVSMTMSAGSDYRVFEGSYSIEDANGSGTYAGDYEVDLNIYFN